MANLTAGTVPKTLSRMAVPMLAGTFAMNMYNLTNAWFVSRLGTEALAAFSFTLPVVMLLMFVTRGLGTGALTLVAHAIGSKETHKAATIATHAMLLSVLFAVVVSTVGILTIKPIFARLGAAGAVLDLTSQYMTVWYVGAVIMVLHMIASDIIIGTGNTRAVSLLMVGGTVLNVFFDMGLIFGMFGMPRMGIVGAAVATIIAQMLTLLGALYILRFRMALIDFREMGKDVVLHSWKKILGFGIPGALGMILTPISSAVIVRMVAEYGNTAVAATGVAGRIELFAFMIPMTVGMSLIPFVAQNYGAGRLDRIRKARKGTTLFAILYGLFIGLVFFLIADPMARLFSEEEAVVTVLRSYIYITCLGYGFLEVHRYAGFTLMGVHEPLQASLLDVLRMVVLLIPLSIMGRQLLGLNGIFWGRLATDLLAGGIGILWTARVLALKEAHSLSTQSL